MNKIKEGRLQYGKQQVEFGYCLFESDGKYLLYNSGNSPE